MKKIYLIILLFTTVKSIAVNNSNILKVTAEISGKYGIEMNLKITENSVNGYYYYTKYKTNIPLVGKINNQKSEIILVENPGFENNLNYPTQGFILNISKNKITGKWFDKSPEKELSVSGSFKSEKSKTSSIQGDYESVFNSEKFSGNLELNNIHDEFYLFNISTATESGCVGDIYGVVEIIEKQGKFSKSLCKEIIFEIDNNSVIIEETECDLHGYKCSFDGKYVKQKS